MVRFLRPELRREEAHQELQELPEALAKLVLQQGEATHPEE
jgi:hypothetical protein